jgi:hypothetical protein
MTAGVFFAIVVLLIPTSLTAYLIWLYKRSEAILQRWAEDNDFELLEKSLGPKISYLAWLHRRNLRRADEKSFKARYESLGCPEDKYLWPHWWEVIYEVTVRDKAGNVGTGWVVCRIWRFGVFERVRVYWDEAPKALVSRIYDRRLDD